MTATKRSSRLRLRADRVMRVVILAIVPMLMAPSVRAAGDYLDIGDGGDNTIKRFDATTATFLGIFGGQVGNILKGPRGIVVDPLGNLLVRTRMCLLQKTGRSCGSVHSVTASRL